MAGHSHSANIRFRKDRVDAKRAKTFSKLSRMITVAAKEGGGDPDANAKLRLALDKARVLSMPKDGIERAIKKGTGEGNIGDFEEVVYEGYGPGGVAVMMEILTDNRNRSAADVRMIMEKCGGNLGQNGSVNWMFERKGRWVVPKARDDGEWTEETLMDVVLEAGADWVHFDVMDNHYVPNLTFGPMICQALRKYGIDAPIDVHLMVEPVDDLVAQFADAGASMITFHPEASKHVDRTIQLIHEKGCQAGLVLNPATSVSVLKWVLDELDMVLLMSVNPGFGGQKFIPYIIQKIEQVRAMIDASERRIRLEIDGGVTVDNIGAIGRAGVDTFVSGSSIFGTADYAATIAAMRAQLERA